MLMHKDQLQFQNSCTGLCESQKALAVKSEPSMDRAREGHEEHLLIWPFSYLAIKIKYPHSTLSLSQGKPSWVTTVRFASL